jgi:hypothetical protein
LRLPPLLLAQWRSGQPDALDPHSTQASEVGCDGAGMHWTPIDGATPLHLAFDFHETEVAAWLLAHGADANARASVDAEGFGGHTPLFNAVVCGPWHHEEPTLLLLDNGASQDARAPRLRRRAAAARLLRRKAVAGGVYRNL